MTARQDAWEAYASALSLDPEDFIRIEFFAGWDAAMRYVTDRTLHAKEETP